MKESTTPFVKAFFTINQPLWARFKSLVPNRKRSLVMRGLIEEYNSRAEKKALIQEMDDIKRLPRKKPVKKGDVVHQLRCSRRSL